MNVLSLFDGMSCGMIALDRLGIKVDNYYAAEIDKYATQVSEANYPDIIRLGDVCGVKAKDLPKIDLILAGSPCQGFSFAGKQLAFDDPRSMLFFEFVRLLKECKPKYFLLENVRMKKEYLDVISEQVGVQPIFINSSLVSAQSRQRYYWTNIPGIEQPEERGIVLRDILETNSGENPVKDTERNRRHYKDPDDKSLCMTATMYKGAGNNGMTLVPENLVYDTGDLPEKSSVIKANYYKSSKANFENDTTKGGKFSATGIPQKQFDESLDKMTNNDGKAHCVTARYTAAQPHNSMERKQRTMIPVNMNEDLPENINRIYDNDSKSHKPIKVGMNVEEVKIRKHEVDVPNLQQCILDHYAKCGKDKKQIAEDLNDKYSTVEHYFRKVGSKFFSIPSEEHWPQLKEILGITTDKFDAQIMEFEYQDGVYETKQRVYSENGKSPTLTAGNKEQYIETHNNPKQVGTAVDIKGHDQIKRVYSPDGKSPTVTTCGGGHREPKVVSGAWRARSVDENGKRVDWKETTPKQMLELRKDEKTNSVTSVQKDNVVVSTYEQVTEEEAKGARMVGRAYDEDGKRMDRDGTSVAGLTTQMLELRKDGKSNAITTVGKDSLVANVVSTFPNKRIEKFKETLKENPQPSKNGIIQLNNPSHSSSRVYSPEGKSPTLMAGNSGGGKEPVKINDNVYWRKLTPLECERLQTVPDNYTNHVSNTQRYKMLGNGWTIEVIAHIFENMKLLEDGKDLPKPKGQDTFDF